MPSFRGQSHCTTGISRGTPSRSSNPRPYHRPHRCRTVPRAGLLRPKNNQGRLAHLSAFSHGRGSSSGLHPRHTRASWPSYRLLSSAGSDLSAHHFSSHYEGHTGFATRSGHYYHGRRARRSHRSTTHFLRGGSTKCCHPSNTNRWLYCGTELRSALFRSLVRSPCHPCSRGRRSLGLASRLLSLTCNTRCYCSDGYFSFSRRRRHRFPYRGSCSRRH